MVHDLVEHLHPVLLTPGEWCPGALAEGKVVFDEREGLIVYDRFGALNEYLSGERLRSWTVMRDGVPIPGRRHVMPEDAMRLMNQ